MSNNNKNNIPQSGNNDPPPLPPSTPLPPIPAPPSPIELKTIWDIGKIVAFVVLWYITSDANKALDASVDYTKLVGTTCGVTWMGAKFGLLQGLIMSVQALAIIWASPTLFIYLGPVLTSAFRTPLRLVADFKRAMSSKSKDGKDGSDCGSDKAAQTEKN